MPRSIIPGINAIRNADDRRKETIQALRTNQHPTQNLPRGGSAQERTQEIRDRAKQTRSAIEQSIPPEALASGKSVAARRRATELRTAIANSTDPSSTAIGRRRAKDQAGLQRSYESFAAIRDLPNSAGGISRGVRQKGLEGFYGRMGQINQM